MKRWQADLALLLLTVVWGTTFTIVNQAVRAYPPLAFIALRFAVASVVFLPLLLVRRRELRANLVPGVGLGVLLFLGFATQTLGLARTTPARAAFITGLSVVLVPILSLAFGHRLRPRTLVGVALAVAGLSIVSWGCRWRWFDCAAADIHLPQRALGDVLVLLCAVAFAGHIVAVGHWTRTRPALTLNGIQLVVVCGAAALSSVLVENRPVLAPRVWAAALFLGVVATALALATWLSCQRHTTATHAALIFTLEPVFAAFFSWLWIGERVTRAVWFGGTLMLLGVIAAELPAYGERGASGDVEPIVDDPAVR
jgi:drug/metabolite transporter (DMT)-like permease